MSEPAYKETTLKQLRSFYETARLGSMSAAAAALELSVPTVSQQVHALEREFGVTLVEADGRGSRLTDAGRLLVELVAPFVLGVAGLKERFEEARARLVPRLVVAASPRVLADDLPDCLDEFTRRHPGVRLTARELWEDQVLAAVEGGEADLGFTTRPRPAGAPPWEASEWLDGEPAYELVVVLMTPAGHPLARKRRVTPEDLRAYPLVNNPATLVAPAVLGTLEKFGLFRSAHRTVETLFTETTRRYVARGYGVGLAGRLPGAAPAPGLHERDMSEFFGRSTIHLVRRKGATPSAAARAFAALVKEMLNRPVEPPRRRKT